MVRRKPARSNNSDAEPQATAKRHKTDKEIQSQDSDLPSVVIDIDIASSPEFATSAVRSSVLQNLRSRFQLASHLLQPSSAIEDKYHEQCAYRVSDTIVTLCSVLNLSHAVALTALVYLQMYKNSSKSWLRSTLQPPPEKDKISGREIKRHEQFVMAAACVLLAWKYREDDTRVSKSTRKIFEFLSALYKVYVTQSEKYLGTPSVSGWMLQDEGTEINKLKSQLIEQESHLLQALDYHVGPVPLPHKLVPAYVRKFLIAMAGDISDLQDTALMLDNLVGMLVLDCYKTQICLDYTPGEILVSCIFKAACILDVAEIHPRVFTPSPQSQSYVSHVKDMECRLRDFLTAVGGPVSNVDRISDCLYDIRRYSQLFEE
ncbi:hypothetical protein X943_000946 [Babesia divergens]|uniref:Cyclin N-terminal domain-containing protein n=1 Tax=Babesia divergens TaxID=32595 RepID=A0AAD9GCW7_BABDI|nr:hypothetical protein X943_000946 [Babesia divergens]